MWFQSVMKRLKRRIVGREIEECRFKERRKRENRRF